MRRGDGRGTENNNLGDERVEGGEGKREEQQR